MRIWKKHSSGPQSVGVLLFENFSNHCLANAVEPLRAANTLLGRPAYAWHVLTPDDRPVTSSSGFPVIPTASMREMPGGAALFLMPSYGFRQLVGDRTRRMLSAAARRYDAMVGLDTGAWLLAHAGLLDGRPATIHYDVIDSFAERFPEVAVRRARWVDDGDRKTAGGAMTAFELVLHLIAGAHGTALTLEIAALFLQADPELPAARRPAVGDRYVARALAEMEAAVETPHAIGDLARHVGCSQKELNRRFRRHLGATPATVYRRTRLLAARRMLVDDGLGVAETATRSGYADPSAFTRAFRAEFGVPPRALR